MSRPVSGEFLTLWQYFREAFVPLNNLELPLKPLHRGVCDTLQAAALGDLKKSFIVINIPPRVGKTKLMEAAITWHLAYFPESQFIYTSYANELARASVRYIQETMASQWYQRLFDTQLGAIRQADHFTTLKGGRVYGDGVGGALTGLGAGLKRKAGGWIVVDDPSKPDEALSRVESDKLRFWFENTLKSRRNSSQWTPIVVCMQRLDPEDLSGFLMENYPEDVEIIKFPALVNGESQIPETVDTKSLLDTQRVNPFAFAAQYQQEPIIIGGNLIKTENFRYYPYGDPPKFDLKVITCDTAMKAKEANDYSVLQCWGRTTKPEKRAYLVDQIRGKWQPDDLIKNAAQFYRKNNKPGQPVSYMSIEEAAAGFTLMQELRKKGIPVRGVVRHKDKVTRVKDILAYQATGMVCLPRGAFWLPAFEAETARFREDGKQPEDDQCVIAGTMIRTAGGVCPIEYIRQGDQVMTRKGLRTVLEAGCTGRSDDVWAVVTVSGRVLFATGSHPIWTEEKGFLRVDSLADGMTLRVWQNRSRSFSTESLFAAIPIAKLLRTGGIFAPPGTMSGEASSISTKKFGNKRMGLIGFRKVISSITRTVIRLTTGRITSNLSHTRDTSKSTENEANFNQTHRRNWLTWLVSEIARQLGTPVPRGLNGIGNMLLSRSTSSECIGFDAPIAVGTLGRNNRSPNSVPSNAKHARGEKTRVSTSKEAVNFVENPFGFSDANYRELTDQLAAFVLANAQQRSVWVFNLKVAECPEYVANGFLTHNCDCMADGILILLGKATSILNALGKPRKAA